jgi:hypothetical protein
LTLAIVIGAGSLFMVFVLCLVFVTPQQKPFEDVTSHLPVGEKVTIRRVPSREWFDQWLKANPQVVVVDRQHLHAWAGGYQVTVMRVPTSSTSATAASITP